MASIRGTRDAAVAANIRLKSSAKPAETKKREKKETKKKKKSKAPELSEAAVTAIQRGYDEIGQEPALTMRDHKADQTQEYSHKLVLNGREFNMIHSKKSVKGLPATFHTDEWGKEDALVISLLYALRKRAGRMACTSEMLAEQLGVALAKIDRLEAAKTAVTDELPLHYLVRRNGDTDFFYAAHEHIREFQVDDTGPLLKLTLDDQVGSLFKDVRLLTLHARGTGDILRTPDEFIYADAVRRLVWTRRGGRWVAQPLKSALTGEGQNLIDLFDQDWLPADIIGPYPFDPSLKIKVLSDDTWQIHDSAGGVVTEDGSGMLIYEKGATTISIGIDAMDEVTNFADFKHEVIHDSTPRAETQVTCNRCGRDPALMGGVCEACFLNAVKARDAEKNVAEAAKAAKKRAAEAKAAEAKAAKAKAAEEEAAEEKAAEEEAAMAPNDAVAATKKRAAAASLEGAAKRHKDNDSSEEDGEPDGSDDSEGEGGGSEASVASGDEDD